jgi:multidrug efflux pump subunit AcrA (membrane-fusion protein)
MSINTSSDDEQDIERTKQQIRALVAEIAQLSKSDMEAEEFYPAFLQRIVSALVAVGGAIWTVGEGKKLQLAYQINISESLQNSETEESQHHMRLLHSVMARPEGMLAPPLSAHGDAGMGANPTRYLLVLGPLVADGQVEGIVEVFQRPDSQAAAQRGYLRFLMQMCELAGDWLKSKKLRQFSDRQSLWMQADQFSRMVHESLNLRETAYTLSNEGRRLIGCDRVSVALSKGRKCKVEAVSNQDAFDSRSNMITLLGELATKVAKTGEPLWYDGQTEDLPPQIEETLQKYVDESHAKNVIVLPIKKLKTDQVRREEEQTERAAAEESIGAIIVEQIESDLPRSLLQPRIELVHEHGARAIANAMTHERVFLLPLWRTIGEMSWVLKARTLPKTLAITALVLAAIIALIVIPAPFDMEAPGTLLPENRRNVFVDEPGIVKEVLVDHGDKVQQGDVLMRLESVQLDQEIADNLREIGVAVKTEQTIMAELARGADRSPADRAARERELEQARAKLSGLREEARILQLRKANLEIRSPIDGEILTWDAKNLLLHRPLEKGRAVLEVANEQGGWILELYMSESRAGHMLAEAVDPQTGEFAKRLKVRFILAADPDSILEGELLDVSRRADVHEEHGANVKVRVRITTPEKLRNPRPGTTLTADVRCGKRPVGYVWFHEAFEWCYRHIFF